MHLDEIKTTNTHTLNYRLRAVDYSTIPAQAAEAKAIRAELDRREATADRNSAAMLRWLEKQVATNR